MGGSRRGEGVRGSGGSCERGGFDVGRVSGSAAGGEVRGGWLYLRVNVCSHMVGTSNSSVTIISLSIL